MMAGVGWHFENPMNYLPANIPPDIANFENLGGGITEFLNMENGKLTIWSITLKVLDEAVLVQYFQMLKEFDKRLQTEKDL